MATHNDRKPRDSLSLILSKMACHHQKQRGGKCMHPRPKHICDYTVFLFPEFSFSLTIPVDPAFVQLSRLSLFTIFLLSPSAVFSDFLLFPSFVFFYTPSQHTLSLSNTICFHHFHFLTMAESPLTSPDWSPLMHTALILGYQSIYVYINSHIHVNNITILFYR